MTLEGVPTSPEAEAIVAQLLTEVVFPAKEAQGQLRASSEAKLRDALGAILADLMAAANQRRWAARSTKRKSFTGKQVKEAAFRDVTEALATHGLLEYVKGHTRDMGRMGQTHVSPIFRATPKLLELAGSHNVRAQAVGRHFTFIVPGDG